MKRGGSVRTLGFLYSLINERIQQSNSLVIITAYLVVSLSKYFVPRLTGK